MASKTRKTTRTTKAQRHQIEILRKGVVEAEISLELAVEKNAGKRLNKAQRHQIEILRKAVVEAQISLELAIEMAA